MSEIEYYDLIYEVSTKLDENQLPRLKFMCTGKIGSDEDIQDVLTFLKALERHNHLGIDHLDTLKAILDRIKKRPLVKKVEDFERRRKAQSVGIVSSVKWAASHLKGAVKMVCNFRTIAGGILVVSSGMALRSCSSLEEFVEVFNKVVLISYAKLVEISEGSLFFTVQAETPTALKELWDIYKNGTLQSCLQEFLVTDEIKQLANGEDIEVTVLIDEHEYKEAYLDFLQQKLVIENKGLRRNSDSFLHFKPNQNEMTLMKLKQAENKLSFERQVHEEEIIKLKEKILQAGQLRETGYLEKPKITRRRNSDSNLYYKARDEDTGESEINLEQSLGGATQYLDLEKSKFVENYLQNIHETHSMTTDTSDSGVRTHGAPSDFEMQEITDDDHGFCLKDLSEEVISKLNERLDVDEVARGQIYQSFGIDIASFRFSSFEIRQSKMEIFNLFPDTPVKVLKEVFEALQLYDLVDLLEEGKPQTRRSLRPALSLQGIEKLRDRAGRPTSYHSSAAVLIIDVSEENSSTEGIGNFFKGLNVKSEVTVIQCRDMVKTSLRYDETIFMERRRETLTEKRTQGISEEMEKEHEKFRTAVAAVTERWITNQENFSLFAVFFVRGEEHIWLHDSNVEAIFINLAEKIVTAIPKVVKLIIWPSFWISFRLESSYKETLVVSANLTAGDFLTLMLEIFNKRWQTLDVISMMRELQRSLAYSPQTTTVTGSYRSTYYIHRPRIEEIKYNLSSLPRFKKQEEPTK